MFFVSGEQRFQIFDLADLQQSSDELFATSDILGFSTELMNKHLYSLLIRTFSLPATYRHRHHLSAEIEYSSTDRLVGSRLEAARASAEWNQASKKETTHITRIARFNVLTTGPYKQGYCFSKQVSYSRNASHAQEKALPTPFIRTNITNPNPKISTELEVNSLWQNVHVMSIHLKKISTTSRNDLLRQIVFPGSETYSCKY